MKYIEWIRQRECCVSGTNFGVIAHHVRMGTFAGMGRKPPDYFCVPLNQNCHQDLHQMGERRYWQTLGIDPFAVILNNIENFCHYKNIDLPEVLESNVIDKIKALGEFVL